MSEVGTASHCLTFQDYVQPSVIEFEEKLQDFAIHNGQISIGSYVPLWDLTLFQR